MGRFGSFLLGVVLGAGVVYGSLTYHVIHATDGVHVVRKVSSSLQEVYVDIREFGVSDWNEHKNVAVALVKADKAHLMNDAANYQLRQSVDGVLRGLTGSE